MRERERERERCIVPIMRLSERSIDWTVDPMAPLSNQLKQKGLEFFYVPKKVLAHELGHHLRIIMIVLVAFLVGDAWVHIQGW